MDWQSIVVFSVVFWSTYHLLNVVKDWRRTTELTRILRDMDNLAAKIDRASDDKIKRVK